MLTSMGRRTIRYLEKARRLRGDRGWATPLPLLDWIMPTQTLSLDLLAVHVVDPHRHQYLRSATITDRYSSQFGCSPAAVR